MTAADVKLALQGGETSDAGRGAGSDEEVRNQDTRTTGISTIHRGKDGDLSEQMARPLDTKWEATSRGTKTRLTSIIKNYIANDTKGFAEDIFKVYSIDDRANIQQVSEAFAKDLLSRLNEPQVVLEQDFGRLGLDSDFIQKFRRAAGASRGPARFSTDEEDPALERALEMLREKKPASEIFNATGKVVLANGGIQNGIAGTLQMTAADVKLALQGGEASDTERRNDGVREGTQGKLAARGTDGYTGRTNSSRGARPLADSSTENLGGLGRRTGRNENGPGSDTEEAATRWTTDGDRRSNRSSNKPILWQKGIKFENLSRTIRERLSLLIENYITDDTQGYSEIILDTYAQSDPTNINEAAEGLARDLLEQINEPDAVLEQNFKWFGLDSDFIQKFRRAAGASQGPARFSTDEEETRLTQRAEDSSTQTLRARIRENEAVLSGLDFLESRGKLTASFDGERENIQRAIDIDRASLQKKLAGTAQVRRAAREKALDSSATAQARKDLRAELLNTFHVQPGTRAELGGVIDRYAETLLNKGKVSNADRAALFDRLYEAGAAASEPEELAANVRSVLHGGRIYVPDSVRGDFGDDWQAMKNRAFGSGIFLTSDTNDPGIDSWNQELSSIFGGAFDTEELDMGRALENIVDIAEEGRSENVSLPEMARRAGGDELADAQEEQLRQSVDNALQKFVEKAQLESALKARSAGELAAERTRQREIRERQSRNRQLSELQGKTLKALRWLSRNRNVAPQDMREEYDRVLDGIDLIAVSAADELHWDSKRGATWKDLRDMYLKAKDEDPNFLPSRELDAIVSRLDDAKIGDMDIGALTDLYRAASGLRTEFYNRKNIIGDLEHRTFSEAYENSVKEIKNSGGKGGQGRLHKFLDIEQMSPLNVIEQMGGWDPDGTFYSFGKQLESGEREWKNYIVQAKKLLEDFVGEHRDWLKKADGQGKDAVWYELEVPELLQFNMGDKPIFGKSVKVYMTPAQKVHLYLESQNYQNLQHMAGGRTFADRELYSKGKRAEALAQGTTVRLAPETVKNLVKDLTPEERALADVLAQYYDNFAAGKINEKSNALYGYDKAMTAHYAPIFSNANYTQSTPGIFDVTAEGAGHLKSREQVAKNPSYNLSAIDAFERHVEQTARFVGYAIPIRNMNTLLNWGGDGSSMKDVLTHSWGKEGLDYIDNLMTRLQDPTLDRGMGSIDRAAGKLMSHYITGVFAANPSIILKQTMSFPMAGAVLGFDTLPSPAQLARTRSDFIFKYSPEIAYRSMGYSSPEAAQLTNNPNFLDSNRVTKFWLRGGAMIATDTATARALWPWAENYVTKHFPDLELGTQEIVDAGLSPFYQKVAEVFNEAVVTTQSNYDVMHRPKMATEGGVIQRAFTMFKTDNMQQYNILRKKLGEAAQAKASGADGQTQSMARQGAARTILAILAATVGGVGVNALMNLWKTKGKNYQNADGEIDAESFFNAFGTDLVQNLAGNVLGGQELATYLSSLAGGGKWYGIELPGGEQLNDLIDSATDATKGISQIIGGAADIAANGGDMGEYFRRNSGKLLALVDEAASKLSSYLGGVPYDNIKAYLLGTLRWTSPEIATAYEDLLKNDVKADLKDLSGKALEQGVRDLLGTRGIETSDLAATELSRLYGEGYTDAVPTDAAATISVGGVSRPLSAYEQQTYDKSYADTLGSGLDALLQSDGYLQADNETKEAMLKKLYDYASQTAKLAVDPQYKADDWIGGAKDAQGAGVPLEAYIALKAAGLNGNEDAAAYIEDMNLSKEQQGALYYFSLPASSKGTLDAYLDTGLGYGDVFDLLTSGHKLTKRDQYFDFVESGLTPEQALETESAIDSLGEDAKDAEKFLAIGEQPYPESVKESLLEGIMSADSYAKYTEVRGSGVSTYQYFKFLYDTGDMQADLGSNGKAISGSLKKKILSYIDGMSITAAQKDALYYAAGYAKSTIGDAPWR